MNEPTDKPGCRGCDERDFHKASCKVGYQYTLGLSPVLDSERGSVAVETKPRCPVCGGSVASDWDRDSGTFHPCDSCGHQFSLQQSPEKDFGRMAQATAESLGTWWICANCARPRLMVVGATAADFLCRFCFSVHGIPKATGDRIEKDSEPITSPRTDRVETYYWRETGDRNNAD